MDKITLDKVCRQVYRQFPVLKDKRPKVSKQGEGRHLLVFSSSGQSPDGKNISMNVRVVADDDGKIIKTSMSK
jgi:hypothetical protein